MSYVIPHVVALTSLHSPVLHSDSLRDFWPLSHEPLDCIMCIGFSFNLELHQIHIRSRRGHRNGFSYHWHLLRGLNWNVHVSTYMYLLVYNTCTCISVTYCWNMDFFFLSFAGFKSHWKHVGSTQASHQQESQAQDQRRPCEGHPRLLGHHCYTWTVYKVYWTFKKGAACCCHTSWEGLRILNTEQWTQHILHM